MEKELLKGYRGIKNCLGCPMQWVHSHANLYNSAWIGNATKNSEGLLFDKQKVLNITQAYIAMYEYAKEHKEVTGAKALILPNGSMMFIPY